MPLTRIEVRCSRPAHEIAALMHAVGQAQREALQLPAGDFEIRYHELSPERFVSGPQTSPHRTLVEITMFPGRSLDAKRRLYAGIVQALGPFGIAPTDVLIVLHEPPLANWGLRGGQPACDLDLGFKLDV